MSSTGIEWLRRALLTGVYLLGIVGVLGSTGGVSNSDLECFNFGYSPECADLPPPTSPPIIIPAGGDAEGFNDSVNSIAPALDASDDVYVGGDFTAYKNIAANYVARLNNDGSLDTGFVTGAGFNRGVKIVAPANDGSGDVYIGGSFTRYNGSSVGYIVRLDLDGTLDTSFATGTGFDSNVDTIVPAADGLGAIYVGGSFTSYDGTSVGSGLIRINDDGGLDPGFATGSGWGEVSIASATDGSGDVYVSSKTSPGIARLNSDGSIDAGFDTGPSGFNAEVRAIAVATDGSGDVYVAGYFDAYNGIANSGIVRLNDDGSLDTGFITTGLYVNQGDFITATVDGSRDIYIGANSVAGIVRLNADGTQDTGFETGGWLGGFGDSPNSVALAPDGSSDIYAGGSFTRYNLTPAARIARLTAGGAFVR